MWWFIIWGSSTNLKELGVVADQCPHCDQLAPCCVTGHVRGDHVYFITLNEQVIGGECLCSACGGRFPCDTGRYRDFVPPGDASSMTTETLLERTNPDLKERLLWALEKRTFAADERFEVVSQSVEQLRPGRLRTQLQDGLRRWGQLSEEQRTELLHTVTESARALQFAESVAGRLPGPAGCLVACIACIAVWSAFFWTTAGRHLLSSVALVFAGFVAGAVVFQQIFSRRVRRWAKEVLIPEGEMAGIDFRRFVAILDDLSDPSPRVRGELDGLKENAAAIMKELVATGKVGKDKPAQEIDTRLTSRR